MIRRLFLLCLSLFAVSACATTPPASAGGETMIIVVRHAEKAADDPKDPSLSKAGQARARALAAALSGIKLQAAYATQYRRTQLTATPAAEAAGISVTVLQAGGGDAEALSSKIRELHRGQAVLVVGHSNTVPAIVKALSGIEVAPLGDGDYDRAFVVTLSGAGDARLVQLKY